jgi:dihydroneopterin aldolase
MDKIFLKNLRLKTRIGIFAWEKQIDQIINIDLEIGTDIKKAAETDDVQYSLDYKTLSKKIIDYVENNKHDLVEALIENIANMVLKEFKVEYITISIGKPGAIRGSQDVGITITRKK